MKNSCKLTCLNCISHHSLWQLSNDKIDQCASFPAHLVLQVFLSLPGNETRNMNFCPILFWELVRFNLFWPQLLHWFSNFEHTNLPRWLAANVDQICYLLWSWTACLHRKCLFTSCLWVGKSEIDDANRQVCLFKLVQKTPKKWVADVDCALVQIISIVSNNK